MIYTHLNPDLDAICSVWVVRRYILQDPEASVTFLPAGWDGEGSANWSVASTDWIVDMEAGGKGIKGDRDPDGVTHSCFQYLMVTHAPLVDRQALRELITFEDRQDAKGNALRFFMSEQGQIHRNIVDAVSILSVLRALKLYHNEDHKTLEAMMPILDGMLLDGKKREKNRERLLDTRWFGRVALCLDGGPQLSEMLFDQGALAVVYKHGNNLGIVRGPVSKVRVAFPWIQDQIALRGEIEDWFEHPSGFLFAHGTIKNHASRPSQLHADAIAEALDIYLKNHDENY